jgi:hypothetical protein
MVAVKNLVWVALLLFIALPALTWAEQIKLDQTLEFKWRGLSVATMAFNASIPVLATGASTADKAASAKADAGYIEIVGQTKGPLRWFEDYQATVSYLAFSGEDGNALTLSGVDNGEPEERKIVFRPNSLPVIEVFQDSTVKQALIPKADWMTNTANPLGVFKTLLEAAVSGESCATQTWGYDGKRRYKLELEGPKRDTNDSQAPGKEKGELIYHCDLTMYAKGRQSAGMESRRKPSVLTSRFVALWPFGSTDRKLSFRLRLLDSAESWDAVLTHIDEIRIETPLGDIVGKSL